MIQAFIAEISREIEMRNKVYPGRVSAGKMTQANADKKIILMKNIRAVLEHGADSEGCLALRLPIRIHANFVISTLDPHLKEVQGEIKWRETLLEKNGAAYGAATKALKKHQLALMRSVASILSHIITESAGTAEQQKLF